MNDRIFIDTNVLVYAYDRSEPTKQAQALDLLDTVIPTGSAVISTQVLSEFYVAVTRKIAVPFDQDTAYTRVQHLARAMDVVPLTSMIVLEAVRGVRDYLFTFWDAQIWAAAHLNQVPIVLSEDFNSGSSIEGVSFENPFAASFQTETFI